MSSQDPNQTNQKYNFFRHWEWSAVATIIGIILLFSTSIVVVLIAPQYVDPTWTTPSCSYQVQMYEIADPNIYISSSTNPSFQFVQHLRKDFTLSAFVETENEKIVAPPELEKFITRENEKVLKLSSRLLMLRKPIKTDKFNAIASADEVNAKAKSSLEKQIKEGKQKRSQGSFEVLELYEMEGDEAFAIANSESSVENWADKKFIVLDEVTKQDYHGNHGVIYVKNPIEYRISNYAINERQSWRYDPNGTPIKSLQELKDHALGFRSRAELIAYGEHIYAIEGCWYCHTDQTRTLVQDVVLNGSDSYPAPPSSASEYIYQKITFPGTRRIGPDISRVGIKRPSRDWHKAHFWSPKTASKGSIMPAFRHFFDDDPRGTSKLMTGIPNYKFESIFQYMMTKGTRITPPSQAWWIGKDPVHTKEIIEGQQELKK